MINGTKLFVTDASIADYFLCVARTKEATNDEDGITIFLVDTKSAGTKQTKEVLAILSVRPARLKTSYAQVGLSYRS